MQIPGDRRLIIGGAAAALVVLVLVLVLVLRGGDDGTAPSSASSPSASGTSSAGPGVASPSPSAAGSDGPTPSAAPVETKSPKPTPAPLKSKVDLDNGVAIQVTDIESVKGEARGPGEVAGPALRFTIQVTNGSRKPLNLDLALVTVYAGADDTPVSDLSGPGVSRLPSRLKPGASATGKYVFTVPENQRQRVRVDFSYVINQPTIIFRGPAG